jgi:hypothetical protein
VRDGGGRVAGDGQGQPSAHAQGSRAVGVRVGLIVFPTSEGRTAERAGSARTPRLRLEPAPVRGAGVGEWGLRGCAQRSTGISTGGWEGVRAAGEGEWERGGGYAQPSTALLLRSALLGGLRAEGLRASRRGRRGGGEDEGRPWRRWGGVCTLQTSVQGGRAPAVRGNRARGGCTGKASRGRREGRPRGRRGPHDPPSTGQKGGKSATDWFLAPVDSWGEVW